MAWDETWALVTDGVRARIVRDLEGRAAVPRPELIGKARSAHLEAFLSDRPPPFVNTDRTAWLTTLMPGSYLIVADMRDFARVVIDRLLRHLRLGGFQRLALFAKPRMLDILREEMPVELSETVVLECACDLVSLPVHDLREEVSRTVWKTGRT